MAVKITFCNQSDHRLSSRAFSRSCRESVQVVVKRVTQSELAKPELVKQAFIVIIIIKTLQY